MSAAMNDVLYRHHDFRLEARELRIPDVLREKHYIYHIRTDEYGCLVCERDKDGKRLRTPRQLGDMCIYKLVQEPRIFTVVKASLLPSNCYHLLLTEAIRQREARAIEWVVSTWPMRYLRVWEQIPLEEYLEDHYLTLPFEGNDKMCLVDCFVLGLLKLRPEANLRHIDFTGFDKDRKLCKELSRLPILWMKPDDRTKESIHQQMSTSLEVSKDKAQRYLNRISVVYCNVDNEFKHGNQIAPVTVWLDLKVWLDDVPLGLSLQSATPFRFKCQRLWMKPISEVSFPPANLGATLDTTKITHFEYEDPLLPIDEQKYESLLSGIKQLKFLIALSLPNCLDSHINQEMASKLNHVLQKLPYIQRLSFSYCNLRNQLHLLLGGLRHHLLFLNLKDTRLTDADLTFLMQHRCLGILRELHLSCNPLQEVIDQFLGILAKMAHLTCLGISHCQLNTHQLLLVVHQLIRDASPLKVLSMQGYTPLTVNDTLEILRSCARVKSLQKVLLFPEAYGFPGANEKEREINRLSALQTGYRYLEMRSRSDILLE